jgi:hypothetical protein
LVWPGDNKQAGVVMNDKLFAPFNWQAAWDWINRIWAKSLVSVGCLLIGLGVGGVMAESRIVSDCKFANSFRVDIQAFTCQRKI